MKKGSLFYLFGFIFILTQTSCEKCKTCHITITDNYAGYDQTSSTSEEFCGDDYDNAPSESQNVQSSIEGTKTTVTSCD